jgi:hypothetical protein
MTNRAMGDSKKQVILIMYADAANKIILSNVNLRALLALIIPLGISLMAVLGFFASNSLSKYLLKAIAALRAKTIHKSMSPKSLGSKLYPSLNIARQKPIKAKGKANTVWLNLISDK